MTVPYTIDQLQELVNLNTVHQAAVAPLLAFYNWVKQTWQICEIAKVRSAMGLDLRRPSDRLALAQEAARRELDFQRALPPAPQPQALPSVTSATSAQVVAEEWALRLRQWEEFSRLLLLGRILAAPQKTNGTEHSESFRCFGSPVTLEQLKERRKYLLKAAHPDQSGLPDAQVRFSFIKEMVDGAIQNWERVNPVNRISQQEYAGRMGYKLPNGWTPESFWLPAKALMEGSAGG
jgi:hypothetical protein